MYQFAQFDLEPYKENRIVHSCHNYTRFRPYLDTIYMFDFDYILRYFYNKIHDEIPIISVQQGQDAKINQKLKGGEL